MKENRLYLQHMIDAIQATETFVENVSKTEFLKSDLIQSAVIRKVEIIGEAAKNLTRSFRNKHKSIPWKRIAGMRDKLIHGYFGVDLKRVWAVLQKDLPSLKEQVHRILEEVDAGFDRNSRK